MPKFLVHLWLVVVPAMMLAGTVSASPIQISAVPCFSSMNGKGVFPVVVTVSNAGDSVSGSIQVSAKSYGPPDRVYDYPVDLPTGAEKTIIVYPSLPEYTSNINVDFDGPNAPKTVEVSMDDGGDYSNLDNDFEAGYLGDATGVLEAARTVSRSTYSATPQDRFTDSYCRPEAAPDRGVGYGRLNVLAIGGGAERLSDDQWNAVRDWVLGGGSLLLFGGSGSLAYLNTTGADQLDPVESLHETSSPSVTIPVKGGVLQVQNVSIVAGSARPGASVLLSGSNGPLITSWCYGAGRVTLVAFDPSQAPFRAIQQQNALISTLFKTAAPAAASPLTKALITQLSSSRTAGDTTSGGPTDPFDVHLPPISIIALILAAYFILVVPVTYVVLRRLGRLEWTWLTTPVLSIIFAFVFYLFTADLYKVGLVRHTVGVIATTSGSAAARFTGVTDLFFPLAGSYSLVLPQAEQVEPSTGDAPELGLSMGTDVLQTDDTGLGIVARNYSVSNLSFRSLKHTEDVSLGGSVTGTFDWHSGRLRGKILNNSTTLLSQVNVVIPAKDERFALSDVKPGENMVVPATASSDETNEFDGLSGSTSVFGANSHGASVPQQLAAALKSQPYAYLIAEVPGSGYGPQTGREISAAHGVVLLVSCPVTLGGKE